MHSVMAWAATHIVAGTLLTDLALMILAALVIVVAARFAFLGARFALRALDLIRAPEDW